MSILFLFGAGASYGSLDCIPYPPPLGYQLFDKLKKVGGIASTIHGELLDLFRQDFEQGTDRFFHQRNEDVVPFLREMAAYFARFEPGTNNLYRKLIESIMRLDKEVVFSTINYEMLIEIAATQAGLIVYHNGRPFLKQTLPVLKLHGSCNFLPDIRGRLKNFTFRGVTSTRATLIQAPVRIATSYGEISQFLKSEESVAPAIALYASSKWLPFCRKYIEKQQKFWQDEVYRANCIYIIGAGIHEQDTYIWEPLAKSLTFLGYVGPNSDAFYGWVERNNRSCAEVIAPSFEDAIPIIKHYLDRV